MQEVEICIVGAGHGGLVTAILLGQKGYDVHIYEKNSENQLGFDWRDDIDSRAFIYAGLPDFVTNDEYYVMMNYTILPPDQKSVVCTTYPPENREWSIDRKVLIKNLIKKAKDAGVHFHFNVKVLEPIIQNEEIIGIKCELNGTLDEIKAKLIIDNAGFQSPIRTNLPDSFGITTKLYRGQIFYIYRAYFNEINPISKFTVFMGYHHQPEIVWINHASPNCADILIAKMDPITNDEIDAVLADLRSKCPDIGYDLKAGGYIVEIPVRRPFNLLVSNRYALVGDAACMGSPLNASGVGPAIKAGKILADTICSLDRNTTTYRLPELYLYQYKYFKEYGAAYAQLEILKNWMLTSNLTDVDFAFANGLIASVDIERAFKALPIDGSLMTIVRKAFKGFLRLDILIRMKFMLDLANRVQKHYENPPIHYDPLLIQKWRKKGDEYFKNAEKTFQKSDISSQ